MRQLRLAPAVAALGAVVLAGCEREKFGSEPAKPACLFEASQRFYSGQALPGEFLTPESLPLIPPSFEEPHQ